MNKDTGIGKRCPKCGRDDVPFYHSNRADGFQGHCKACKDVVSKRYQREHPECKARQWKKGKAKREADPVMMAEWKESRRWIWFKHRYNITKEQWDIRFESQGRRCANPGCRTDDPGNGGWHIDHDHRSGYRCCGKCKRGILCQRCNQALGLLDDGAEKIRGLADYVELVTGNFQAAALAA